MFNVISSEKLILTSEERIRKYPTESVYHIKVQAMHSDCAYELSVFTFDRFNLFINLGQSITSF